MARSFLGGEFAGGESALWRGNWIPWHLILYDVEIRGDSNTHYQLCLLLKF